MNVEQYLSSFFKGTKDPSLNAMEYFMEEFGHPEKSLNIIHIAGTNGKGSCVEMMANILIKSGYKVGKFMSPHLVKYNERISVSNEFISDSEMGKLLEEIKPKVDKYNSEHTTKVTLFEVETTMAILYFYRKKCDIVVLETGLGGLYDCTNIVNPIVSVITSIGYDHMDILGNTLLEIAEQKAGIIKPNSDTVFAITDDEKVNERIKEICESKNNKLHLVKMEQIKNSSYDDEFQKFDYKNYDNILINLKGEKQFLNAGICIECTEILREKNFGISETALREGLKNVVHKGRFEIVNKEPLMIYDGAHNEPAIKNFIKTRDMYYASRKKVYIVSILKTKDYNMVLKELLQDENSVFIFTDGNDIERYVEKEILLETAKKYTENKNLHIMSLEEAINYARDYHKNDVTFIVGSFYVYGDVMELLEGNE